VNNGSGPLSETTDHAEQGPPPGRVAVLLTALSIGILLMGIQLWLLTIALDLYLAGGSIEIWILVIISGLVFLGGVLVWRVLRRNPRSIRQLS
jgi:hypothetical protein